MDIHQLKTFAAVAREGNITRASKRVHLSQPAVSAHIKALEDALGLALFERTPKGMRLTTEGQRMLAKAEQTIAAHEELLGEATRIKGKLRGHLRLGAGSSTDHAAVGRLLTGLAERSPDLDVTLKHGSSREILARVRSGELDAGFYNDAGEPGADLAVVEVARFAIFVAAAPKLVPKSKAPNWKALAEVPWIYPTASSCCGDTAEALFKANRFRPKRVIDVDRGELTRPLVAAGTGVGLLHEGAAREAKARNEVELLHECETSVRVLFAHLRSRAQDPVLAAATGILTAAPRLP